MNSFTMRSWAAPRAWTSSGILATPAIQAATLLWGVSTSAAKLALLDWPPFTQAWLRFVVALLVLIPLNRMMGSRLALGRMPALLGLIGVALFYALHNLGLQFTSGVNASLILDGGTPALMIVFGAVLLRERPGRRAGAGLLISLGGIGVVVLANDSSGFGSLGLGDLLIVVSAALWALYAVIGKGVFAARGVLPVVSGSSLYGVLFLALPALVEISHGGGPTLTWQGGGIMLFLGAGCSALAYLFLGHALTHLTAWKVASWSTLMPLVGVVAAMILLREGFGTWQLAGGGLILLGVVLTSLPDAADVGRKAAPLDSSQPDADHIYPGAPRRVAEDQSPPIERETSARRSPVEQKHWRRQRPYGVPEQWDLPMQWERSERKPQNALANVERETRAAALRAS